MMVAVSASSWRRSARPDRLHDVDDRFLRRGEQHRVDGRARPRPRPGSGRWRPPTSRPGRVPQPVQHQLPLGAAHLAVDVPGRDRAVRPAAGRGQQPSVAGQGAGELAGLGDRGARTPAQRRSPNCAAVIASAAWAAAIRTGTPPSPTRPLLPVEQVADLAVGDGGDHDPVVLQPARRRSPGGTGRCRRPGRTPSRRPSRRPAASRPPRSRCRSAGWPSCTGAAVPACTPGSRIAAVALPAAPASRCASSQTVSSATCPARRSPSASRCAES